MRPVPAGCDRCQQPLPPEGPCRFCEDWPDGFVSASSAVWLGEEAREVVHYLKYEGFTRLAEIAATGIAQNCHPPAGPATLIPIPLGKRRSLERGYNQAAEIASALSVHWSVAVDASCIRRIRETASQTALTPEARKLNMKSVFEAILPARAVSNAPRMCTTGDPIDTESATVAPTKEVAILVDDVLTTGSTLASAAAALLDAGWEEVRAVTFARALPFAVRVETQR